MDKRGGAARVEATEAGPFYLRNGRCPGDADPADRGEPSVPAESLTPYGERPVAHVMPCWADREMRAITRMDVQS